MGELVSKIILLSLLIFSSNALAGNQCKPIKGVVIYRYSKKDIAQNDDYLKDNSCIKSRPIDIEYQVYYYSINDIGKAVLDSLMAANNTDTEFRWKDQPLSNSMLVHKVMSDSGQNYYERKRFGEYLYKIFYLEGVAEKQAIGQFDHAGKRKFSTPYGKTLYNFYSITVFKQIKFDDYWTNIFLEDL